MTRAMIKDGLFGWFFTLAAGFAFGRWQHSLAAGFFAAIVVHGLYGIAWAIEFREEAAKDYLKAEARRKQRKAEKERARVIN